MVLESTAFSFESSVSGVAVEMVLPIVGVPPGRVPVGHPTPKQTGNKESANRCNRRIGFNRGISLADSAVGDVRGEPLRPGGEGESRMSRLGT